MSLDKKSADAFLLRKPLKAGANAFSYHDDDSPYNRSAKEPLTLGLLEECIRQMINTREPLPHSVSEQILEDIGLLKTSNEARVLRKSKGQPKLDPKKEFMQHQVVSYVENSIRSKLDPDPLRTIEEQLCIGRETYKYYKSKCPDYIIEMDEFPFADESLIIPKEEYEFSRLCPLLKLKIEYLRKYFMRS